MVLLDTTVLVDALRGHSEALRYIEQLPDRPAISSVTVAELYAGVRAEEEEALHQFISIFNVFPVDASVAHGRVTGDATLVPVTAHRSLMR